MTAKRLIDIAAAFVITIFTLPLTGLITLLIALGRDGPVFFCQQRVGRGQKLFTIWKFRTMRQRPSEQIDQMDEAVVTAGHDQRITPLGRILRATSLDELPQLLNVLNGSMSIVGPRPVIPEQLLAIPADYKQRFAVRPGVTGWAQVNGRRGLDWMKQLELDVWYVQHWSLLLDLRILWRTIWVVLRGSGVYGDASKNWRAYIKQNIDE